jgi:DNA-directed RNA polymerase specialized sigma24 family protein
MSTAARSARRSWQMPDSELHNSWQPVGTLNGVAFEQVFKLHRSRVFNYLRGLGASYQSAEDILQDTFLNAYQAFQTGRYYHVSEIALAAWLRTVARHLWFRSESSVDIDERCETSASLSAEDESALDSAGKTVPSAPPLDGVAEQTELFALLNEQFDELLIHSQSSQGDKDIGRLRKGAFMRFYLEGFSQKEILNAAIEEAEQLNIVPKMTLACINNWISRGDLLKTLVGRLVERNPETVDKLRRIWHRASDLTDEEREVLRMEWEFGRCAREIAIFRSQPVSVVIATLASAKAKVAARLFVTVKRELHQSRAKKTALRRHV